MTRKELPAQAANIQRAVASPTACTSATVESLRSFLAPTLKPVFQQKRPSANVPLPKVKGSSARPVKTSVARAGRRPAVDILEVQGEHVDQIQSKDKLILATGVVNATLKSLTDAIKNPPAREGTPANRKPLARSSSGCCSSNGLESRNQTPLQPLCVNRLTDSPGKQNRYQRSSSSLSVKQTIDGLRAQAECARIAFATLRFLQFQKDSTTALPYLQLESGMSALIAKMLVLGFDDIALRELRILKRRLDSHNDASSDQGVATSAGLWKDEDNLDPKTETLAEMLRFRNVTARGQLLSLITITQSQVLKVLALRRDASATETALKHLQFSAPHSPANLIRQQLEVDVPGSEAKVARQLESLTQALIALCPPISVRDGRSLAPDGNVPPEITLQIQVLAFQVRSMWWEISGHQGDVAKDIIAPFTRCLAIYSSHSKSIKAKKYEMARNALGNIKECVQNMKGYREEVLILTFQLLAEMAQESSLYSEAIRWARKAREYAPKSALSRVQICNLNCRLASLELQLPDSEPSERLIFLLRDAAQSLEGDLHGDSAELDELLLTIVSLRRSAFSIFQSSHRSSKAKEKRPRTALVHECTNIVLLCAKFFVRYVGNGDSREGHDKTTVRRDQRRRLAARFAAPGIESVVAMARLSADSEAKTWDALEMGLRDCSRLALSVADYVTNEPRATGEDNQASSFSSISNAYWYRYQYLKRETTDAKSCRQCLLVSIGLVRDRPLCDQLAGCLPLKLEKFGQLCEDLRDFEKAADSYSEALHVELGSGPLRTAMENAAVLPIPNGLAPESELLPFSRKLSAYLRVASKAIDQGSRRPLFFDAKELSASERGVLLERQLVSLLSTVNLQSPTPTIYNVMNEIGILLLSTYELDKFPVRRLRVVVRLLRLTITVPGAVRNDLLDQLLEEPKKIGTGNHSDTRLLSFLPHLLTCRRLLIAQRQKPSNIKELESVITSWSNLVQESVGWDSLQTQVYDIADWLIQLEMLVEYLDMQGLELYKASALNIVVMVHEAASLVQCSALVSRLSELGSQHVKLGYSGLAGCVLHKAQRYLKASELTDMVKLRWHISYAEYALASGNVKTCKETLTRAREIFNGGACNKKPEEMRSKDWSDLSQTIADAYYVHSLLAAAEGQSSTALFFARLCVKNCHRSWAILERSQNKFDDAVRKVPDGNEKDPLVDGISVLSISASTEIISTHHSMLSGVAFWTLVPRLIRGLHHLSLLFSYNGLFPEVRYYLQQSQTVAEAVKSASLNGQTTALLGNYSIRSGGVDEGMLLVQQAENLVSGLPHDRHYASMQLFLATHHTKRGELRAGESAIGLAESTIQNLVAKSFMDSLIQRRLTVANLENDMRALTIQETKPVRAVRGRQRQTNSKKPQGNSLAQRDTSKPSREEAPAVEVSGLHRLRCKTIQGRIQAKIAGGSLDAAASLLNETDTHIHDPQDLVMRALLTSRVHFRQGLEHFVSDPIFCVLPESIISCPAVKSSDCDGQDKQNKPSSPSKSRSVTSSKTATGKALTKRVKPRSLSLAKDQAKFLRLAQDEISKVFKSATTSSSTTVVHELSDMLGKILLVLSAISAASSRTSISPGVLSYFLEVGRNLSMTRERLAIRVECELPCGKDAFDWPKDDAVAGQESARMHEKLELSTFQAQYIEIIPQDWDVVSMTLSQERDEILVSKMRSGQTPFILRLPLDRHNPLDQDEVEETFGYDQGRAELQDLVSLANDTAHSSHDISQKGAKTKWWETRATLDARLKDLLTNMESIWFGGFKAIFSQRQQSPALLSRFQQSLQNILDKHLPSRQKLGRGGQSSRVALDLRVLELFVGLGNPSESNDLDDPLVDLLYFVVDILQFNGERNAYDEIDFDSIVIDIIDVLRQYHQAAEKEQANESEKHTILILDKRLHCFPWESLPCLREQAVSRLPSLGCLRDRILQQRRDSTSIDGRLYTSRYSGASILNPGGDLMATQAKFEEPLQELSGWECIVEREPTEAQMKSCLESNDIFLYFGHGSGGQYIRSRTIKKLDKCAVALLMGCSSGSLTEAGEFEPNGTPMNYMHAGCPAMLATLWDVTDKDIDRFSQTVLEKWGLFEDRQPSISSSPVKKGTKQKGKGRANNTENVDRGKSRPISLDQAVAKGRDSCILRYLNGAAPVVYGVPVYLR